MLVTVRIKFAHEIIVAVSGYLLGEIGVDICENPGYEQFAALHQHYASTKVQGILLTTYMKLVNFYPEQCKDVILGIFDKYSKSSLLEIQQRACEYKALSRMSADVLEHVLNTIPAFTLEGKESILVSLENQDGKSNNADRSAFEQSESRPAAKSSTSVEGNATVVKAPTIPC